MDPTKGKNEGKGSSPASAGDSSPGGKPSTGLSASDLRARLGLKQAGKSATTSGLRSRLGLDGGPTSPPSALLGGPPGALTTAPIDKGTLQKLREGVSGTTDALAARPKPPAAQAPVIAAQKSESTHALSLEDVEDLFIDEDDGDGATVVAPNATAAQALIQDARMDFARAQDEEVDAALGILDGGLSGESPIAPSRGQFGSGDLVTMDSELVEVVEDAPEPSGPDAADLLAGEKTSLLDTSSMFEEEEFDAFPDGEKTQMIPSMDFEPLTGRLVVESGEAPQSEYILARDRTTLGRGTKNGIVIPDIAMSRQHLAFERFTEGFTIRDLESGNGTFVNGRRVVYAELRNGDSVEVGNIVGRFEQSGGDPDKLWRGDPKVQYHPKDTGSPSSRSAPDAPQAAVASGPQSLLQNPNTAGWQQGGGMMSGPGGYPGQWNPAMGMPPGYPPHMAMPQKKGSPVVTALIVFFGIVLVGLVGLIVWSLVQHNKAPEEEVQQESDEERLARAQEFVQQGSTFFDQRRWDDAHVAFAQALELDPNNATARMFVDELIGRERITEERIMKAMGDIKSDPTAGNYEKALQILLAVDADSTFASEVRNQHLPAVKRNFRTLLLRNARKELDSGNLAVAKRDLQKIKEDLGMKNDAEVEEMLKQVEAKRPNKP